jgi:hypothetical protein
MKAKPLGNTTKRRKHRWWSLVLPVVVSVVLIVLVVIGARDCDDVCAEAGMISADRHQGCAVACLCRSPKKPEPELEPKAPPVIAVPDQKTEACTADCWEVIPGSFGSIGMKSGWSYVNEVGPMFGPPGAPSRCYCWEGPPHQTTDADRAEAKRLRSGPMKELQAAREERLELVSMVSRQQEEERERRARAAEKLRQEDPARQLEEVRQMRKLLEVTDAE